MEREYTRWRYGITMVSAPSDAWRAMPVRQTPRWGRGRFRRPCVRLRNTLRALSAPRAKIEKADQAHAFKGLDTGVGDVQSSGGLEREDAVEVHSRMGKNPDGKARRSPPTRIPQPTEFLRA